MRYIGNKTRLLGFIRRVLRSRGIEPGLALDPFTGTASVARALKRWGHRVVAGDLMEYGHVFARAHVQTEAAPTFPGLHALLNGAPRSLRGVLGLLEALPPRAGFIYEHFCPEGGPARKHGDGRMYFTPENAGRIDAVRETVEDWRREGRVSEDEYYLLLTSLIDGADRVANTAGVYAAFIKSWQPNARRSLKLRAPRPVLGPGCVAVRSDAVALVRDVGACDLLYIDPPYNERQYPGYYHIPEILAVGWFDGPLRLRGKTGLLPDQEKRSAWARRGGCEDALEELVAAASCRHIVMSYNSEGLIPGASIERVLRRHGRAGSYRRYTRRYRRYRSATERDGGGAAPEMVEEYLYCVDR